MRFIPKRYAVLERGQFKLIQLVSVPERRLAAPTSLTVAPLLAQA
jgi:hypothetical protein